MINERPLPVIALVPAAGSGSRLGHALPKQYVPVGDRPLIHHTLARLASHSRIDRVVVVLSADDSRFDTEDGATMPGKLEVLRTGGATRAETVRNGLRALSGATDSRAWILVHDAARPCVTHGLIDRMLHELEDDPVGGIAALPVADTLKRADADRRIAGTVVRTGLWAAQTPQMFRLGPLLAALEAADPAHITDEAGAMEAAGHRPRLVEGDATNIKVTYARDVALAARFLGQDGL